MDGKKRVACLYRVSTKAQVDRFTDDIPMQKNACHAFIETKPDWELTLEFFEKGVSGFKKKAENRDVLQQIKADAQNKKFDVLLVFMFDRLGRREDETPFIVEWFDTQGIECWSVKEGQQKFENRADKLINYIRYWQSGGESEKTGIRVKEKHLQMIKEGKYCGGPAPYGYKLIRAGAQNAKGREIKSLVIDEEEARVVELVYKLATQNGWGGQRISVHLNEQGIPTRKNAKWGLSVVNYMLRNPIYKGFPSYGKTSAKSGSGRRSNPDDWFISEVKIENLAIVDEDVWEKAQIIRKARTPARLRPENADSIKYPMQTKGRLLFTGLIKCGYCGSTMSSYMSLTKKKSGDGSIKETKPSYRCTGVNRGIHCDGQVTYVAKKIEEPVLEEINVLLQGVERKNLGEYINEIRKRAVQNDERELKRLDFETARIDNEIDRLNSEIVKALGGDSDFTPEQLSLAIKQKNSEKACCSERKSELSEKLANKTRGAYEPREMIPDWVGEFGMAPTDMRKMIAAEILRDVVVYKDRIEVNFKAEIEDFFACDAAPL